VVKDLSEMDTRADPIRGLYMVHCHELSRYLSLKRREAGGLVQHWASEWNGEWGCEGDE
jgi:hypothetical protein